MAYLKNTLRYNIVIIVLLLGFFACTPKTGLNIQSYNTNINLSRDSLVGYISLPENEVFIKIRHDEDSLWMSLKTADPISVRSLLTNGVSFYIDPEHKNKPKYGIAFPAARAEMLQRQKEQPIRHRIDIETGDTIAFRPFQPQVWVEALQRRQAVVTDKSGTRFATQKNSSVFLEDQKTLYYLVSFSFTQLGFDTIPEKLNLGVISELHQAVLAGQQQGGGGMGGPPQRTRNDPRSRPQTQQQATQRVRLIPLNVWITVFVGDNMPETSK